MRRQRVDQIEAVLHARRRRPRGYRVTPVRVDRKAERLRARLMLVRVVGECKRGRRIVGGAVAGKIPSREHPRRGIHIVFRVVADAAREQLHQFAAEVLLRLRFGIGVPVEPDQHRRISGDGDEQVAEASESARAKQLDLPLLVRRIFRRLRRHQPRRVLRFDGSGQLRIPGREVVVPEDRHLLLQGTVRVHHPEQPSLARIVGHRVRRKRSAMRRRLHVTGRADLGVDGVGDALEIQQPIDRL